MTKLSAVLIAGLALVATGCGGGGGDDAAATSAPGSTASTPSSTDGGVQPNAETVPPPPRSAYGAEAPELGRSLMTFVRAAGRGDADAMWSLMSEPTQASIGPTLEDFRVGAANEFREGLGTLAPTAKVVLSRRLPTTWGVATVAGQRTVEGQEEFFAYGTALINEGGRWKIELGGIVVTELRPDPLSETDPTPTVGANVGGSDAIETALLWLDGKPFRVPRKVTTFTTRFEGKPPPLSPGHHVVVVFAATELTASATAWTFNVEP